MVQRGEQEVTLRPLQVQLSHCGLQREVRGPLSDSCISRIREALNSQPTLGSADYQAQNELCDFSSRSRTCRPVAPATSSWTIVSVVIIPNISAASSIPSVIGTEDDSNNKCLPAAGGGESGPAEVDRREPRVHFGKPHKVSPKFPFSFVRAKTDKSALRHFLHLPLSRPNSRTNPPFL